RLDEEALVTYARLAHAYVGVIGCRRKIYRILQRIAARRGVPALDRVYAPIGLDLGAVTPEDTVVSTTGWLVAPRHGTPASHMRAIDDPALARVLAGTLPAEAAAQFSTSTGALMPSLKQPRGSKSGPPSLAGQQSPLFAPYDE